MLLANFRSKFRNKRVSHAGYSFASKLEASVYDVLRLMEQAGEITDISVQPTVRLTNAQIAYRPDFKYQDLATGQTHYVEAKGFETPEWRIKRRLWEHYGPGKLFIYRQVRGGVVRCDEVIDPK